MSLDTTKPTGSAIKPSHRTVKQLLDLAKADTDEVSCFVDGTNWGDASGAIFVVRGGGSAKHVHDLLVSFGYITPGKQVSGA